MAINNMYEDTTRGERFAQYLALEVKGAIVATGHTLIGTCAAAGVNQATFYRYTKGARSITVPVAFDMCEHIGVDLRNLVSRAHSRLLNELGPYEPNAPQNSPANVQFLSYPDPDVAPHSRAAQTLGDLDNEETGEMDQP